MSHSPREAPRFLALLLGGLMMSAPVAAAGPKTAGSSAIVDDLLNGSGASVRATAAGALELDGSVGQVSGGVSAAAADSVEAGFYSRMVSTPASAALSQIAGTAGSFQWTDAAPANPAGTSYVVDMSTSDDFTVLAASVEAFGLAATVTGLRGNTTYYSRIHALYMEGDDSAYLSLDSTRTFAAPPLSGMLHNVGPYAMGALWDPFSNSGGETAGPWSVAVSSLPAARQGHAMVLYGNRLYVSGGVNGGANSTVWTAPIQADGAVGAWAATTALPAVRESHAMAAWGGRLYVTGGSDGVARSTVWWAPIKSDGALGAWSVTTALPAARFKHAMAAWGGRLYVTGGDNGAAAQATVYHASINDDGTVGAWSAAQALPAGRSGHGMAVSSGTLYIAGGVGAGVESTVWSSVILPGGAPDAWNETTPLPGERTRHAFAAADGRLYAAGGSDGSSAQATVWSAALNGNLVGSWSEMTALPAGRYLHAMATQGDRLYVVGGSDGSSTLDAILTAALPGTEYLVERSTNAGFTTGYSASGWRSGAAYDFSGLSPNALYLARVRARNPSGVQTAIVSLGSNVTLAALPGLAASAFTSVEMGSLTFRWTAGGNPAGTEFRGQASTSPAFAGTVLTSAWATEVSTSFADLAVNTSYYVRAQARNSALVESPYTVLGATFTLAVAPAASVITTSTAAGLTLEWSANGNPSGTRYEAQVATGASFSPVIQSSVTLSTSAVFGALVSASTFYARVRALNGSNVPSVFDATVSTATGFDFVAPDVSTGGFAAQSGAADGLIASWVSPGDNGAAGTLVAGASFYIQWSTSAPEAVLWSTAAAQVRVATGPVVPGSLAGAAISGLPSRKIVYFRVWTKDQANNYSAPSDTFSAFASPFSFEALEGGGAFDAGSSPSLAVDRAGDLHAAYLGGAGVRELRYIKRTAGVWGAAQAVYPGTPASGAVLALDNAGAPQILYNDTATPQLKLASLSGSWASSIVEAGDFTPGGLAVDAGGRAHISYYDAAAGSLKYARWTGASWSTQTVSNGAAETGSALALDGSGQPHISYYNTAMSLKYSSATAGIWSVSVVDGRGVTLGSSSIVLDGNGSAHIAYGDLTNQLVTYSSWTGSAWSRSVVDAAGQGGGRLGLALDGAGNAAIAYSASNPGVRDLKSAFWTGVGWSTQTVDSLGDQGGEASLALDPSGGVQIAYRDESGRALKAARWAAAALPAPMGGNPRGQAQAPSAFTGTAVSATSIQWSWTDNAANELGFRLYGAANSTGPFTLIKGTSTIGVSAGAGGVKSYVETGLAINTTYFRYAVAVSSGGAVASGEASAYPTNTADVIPPTFVDNQAGDAFWRRDNAAFYDVDFFDTGGSGLSRFQVKASTVAGGAGPDLVDWTDAVVNISAAGAVDSYTGDWLLPAAVFNAMLDGATNYVSARVFDGAGNSAAGTDLFFVKKDTTPPALADNQAGDDVPRSAAGTVYDVDAVDAGSALAAFQYSASTTAASSDAAVIPWTDVAVVSNATSYALNWAVDFPALASGFKNYISLRAWDQAGSTRAIIDAFYAIKVASGPAVAITAPSAGFVSALSQISGTASNPFGVQGVEVSVRRLTDNNYWAGADFNSATQFWFTAAGTAAWSYAAAGIGWVDGAAYRIVARSSDTGGNYSALYSTANFTFDASTPTAGVGVPASGAALASLPAITGTSADPGSAASGVAAVEVRLRRNSDGFWWNFFTEAWSAAEVSTAAAGTTAWSLAPTARLQANLRDAASYYIAARALDNAAPANASDFFAAGSSTFTFTDATPPSAVTDLTGLGGSAPGEIRLSWTAPGDDGTSGMILLGQYRVQYATTAPVAYSTAAAQVVFATGSVQAGSRQSFLIGTLTPGASYFLRLWTQDDEGQWSALSNGATVQATPQPSNKILGHVVMVSSEGITAVQMDCWDEAGNLAATTFTLADGSGTYVLDGVTAGPYKVQATWSANGVSSSVWIDGVAVGSTDMDFVLQLNYTLGAITGTLQTVASASSLASSGYASQSLPAFNQARVELFQAGRQVGKVPVLASGHWNIPHLLPGKYAVRAFNGFDYTDFQDVDLAEGEVRTVGFVYDPLPKAKVFAFPNPARDSVTFRFESALAPLEAQIAVFDIAGNLVREIPGSSIVSPAGGLYHGAWDLKNSRGEGVASGVYLFSVKVKGGNDQSAQVIKKLAVVR